MRIAIASKREPKLRGIRSGVQNCPFFENGDIDYITESVESGVSDTPLSMEETFAGAKNRVQKLRNLHPDADFYVGPEGGVCQIHERSFIFGLIYIENALGKWHVGYGSKVEIPEQFVVPIFEQKKDFGPMLSQHVGIKDLQAKQGVIGLLTGGMLVREDQFRLGGYFPIF